jgi:glycosyltransferase involved in cell wall biosynthesis
VASRRTGTVSPCGGCQGAVDVRPLLPGDAVSESLRIAVQNGALVYGGGEKWTVLLVRGLQERGHQVRLYCQSEEMAERARSEGVDAGLGPLGGHLMFPHALRFGLQLRDFAPDALLLTTFRKVWLGTMAARVAGVPRVVSRIGLETDLPARHWTYRIVYRRWVDAVLVNADGIRREIVSGLGGYDPSRVITVYDGVRLRDGGPLSKEDARRDLGLPADARVVGSVTRLSPQKRIDRMLEAVARVPAAHLVLAGTGELVDELKHQAASLGIEDRVHFLGYRGDVERVLAAFDVFALTSDREGMANAMLEAMAAGVPVISTPVSGAEEALGPDASGTEAGVIAPPEPDDYALALRRLLEDPVRRSRLGNEGRKRAANRFSFAAMVDAWEAILGGAKPWGWHRGASGREV